jgi:hypothetical protein
MNFSTLEHRLEQKRDIRETIKKLSSVANDNSKTEAFIPLSQVGFCLGRYTSEGECCVMETMPTDENDYDTDITRVSCIEALQILDERLKRIEAEIESSHGKAYNVPLKEDGSPRQSLPTEEVVGVDDSTLHANTNANSGNGGSRLKKTTAKRCVKTNAPRDVFEIREYVDDSGATLKHEIVNVSKGREIIQKLHEKAESEAEAEEVKRPGSAVAESFKGSALSQNNRSTAELNFDDEELEDDVSSFAFGSDDDEDFDDDFDDTRLDDDSRFIRELALLSDQKGHLIAPFTRPTPTPTPASSSSSSSSSSASSNSSSQMLSEMNKQQQQSQQQAAASSEQTKKGGSGGGLGSGWKAGFLSSKKTISSKKAAPKRDVVDKETDKDTGKEPRVRFSDSIYDGNSISSYSTNDYGTHNSSSISVGISGSVEHETTQEHLPEKRVSRLAPRMGSQVNLAPVPSSASTSSSKKPVAFTGSIVERFHV